MSENDTASVYDYARAFNIPEGKVQAAMDQAGGDGTKAIAILKANLRSKGDPAFTKRVPNGQPKLEEILMHTPIINPINPEKPSRKEVKNLMQLLSKASFASPASTINPRLDKETDLKYGGIKILQNYLGDPLVDQEELKRKIAELEEQKNPKKVTGHKGFRAKTPADFGVD